MSESANNLNPELAQTANALGSLAPASTTISRDRLLFEAGRAAARPASWIWPSSTLLFATMSALLAGFLFIREPVQTIVVERERIVEVRVPEPPGTSGFPARRESSSHDDETVQLEPSPSPETMRTLQIRRDVLRWGPDMLPVSTHVESTDSPDSEAGEINRWLNVPPGTFTATPQKAQRLFPNLFGDD
jgi:hypothetical protein